MLFGKTSASKLSSSSLTNTAAFGETRNLWGLTRNADGSSGGYSIHNPAQRTYLNTVTRPPKRLKIDLITRAPTGMNVQAECTNAAKLAANTARRSVITSKNPTGILTV